MMVQVHVVKKVKVKVKIILTTGNLLRARKDKFSWNTNLKGNKCKGAKKWTLELEVFLLQVDRRLLGKAFDNSKIEKVTKKIKLIREMKQELKESFLVIEPTDKTGSFVVMEKESYIEEMNYHIDTTGKEIDRDKLVEIEREVLVLQD